MNLRSIIIYLAGPYGSFGTIEENIKIARKYSQELWNEGFTIICPHTNTSHFLNEDNGGISEPDYLDGYLYIVPRCDAIVMLPDWDKSNGAVKEKDLAETLGLPIFEIEKDSMEDIKNFFIKEIVEG